MARSLKHIWHSLVTARSVNPVEALREHMIRVVCVMSGAVSLTLSTVFFIGWILHIIPLDSFLISLALTMVFVGSIHLSGTRLWATAGVIPPLGIYCTALFGSIIGGPRAPAMVLYALAIVVSAILTSRTFSIAMSLLCAATYTSVIALQTLGYLTVPRSGGLIYINRAFIVAGVYVALVAIILYLVNCYRNALNESRAIASELQLRTIELADINRQLEKENSERRKAQAALITSEGRLRNELEKNQLLLREIHHRVKNNFQIIISLLNLQSGTIRDERLLSEFTESANRIRAMALVHETLYHSDNLASIDFAHYLRTIAAEIAHSQTHIGWRPELVCDLEDTRLDIEQAIPCGLIVNELITNAYKYAFPQPRDGAAIIISLRGHGDHLALSVSDNGVGIPLEISNKQPATLGLQLVQVLIKQVHGTCRLEREGGTSWSISVPINHATQTQKQG